MTEPMHTGNWLDLKTGDHFHEFRVPRDTVIELLEAYAAPWKQRVETLQSELDVKQELHLLSVSDLQAEISSLKRRVGELEAEWDDAWVKFFIGHC